MRLIMRILCVCSLFPSLNTFSQQLQWQLATGSEGVCIDAISIYLKDPDTIFAIGDEGLISTDNGTTWNRYSYLGIGGKIEVHPKDSKLLIWTKHNLLISGPMDALTVSSNDGGKTFNLVGYTYAHDGLIKVDLYDLETIYITLEDTRLLRTVDRGVTWEEVVKFPTFEEAIYDFAIAPSNNNIIYMCRVPGVYRSEDYGQTWNRTGLYPTDDVYKHLAVDYKNPDVVYLSVGSIWATNGGVFKSTDGGKTWTKKNNGLRFPNATREFLINPKNSNELFLCSDLLFYRSTDGGESWIPFVNGFQSDSGYGPTSGLVIDTTHNRLFVNLWSTKGAGVYYCDLNGQSGTTKTPREKYLHKSFVLNQNYPNPFNPLTEIRFSVPYDGKATLKVYNLIGQVVATLFDGEATAGEHSVTFNAISTDSREIPSGVYLYELKFGGMRLVHKMVLMR